MGTLTTDTKAAPRAKEPVDPRKLRESTEDIIRRGGVEIDGELLQAAVGSAEGGQRRTEEAATVDERLAELEAITIEVACGVAAIGGAGFWRRSPRALALFRAVEERGAAPGAAQVRAIAVGTKFD